ncbi:site-specific integrase [Taibaiella soli]|uniref:site-specific integrase n=1 Tax=Taibaiella soli TaxID=1649169 RepID=UPI001FB3BEE8|nr:site-specific integrase [Taibaiella soli]
MPDTYGDVALFNKEIKRLYRLAEDLVEYACSMGIKDKLSYVKQHFKVDLDIEVLKEKESAAVIAQQMAIEKKLDIYEQFDAFIESKRKKVSKGMLRIYGYVRERLKVYEVFRGNKVMFENIDYNFYENWLEFLTYDYVQIGRSVDYRGLKLNTIGLTVKHFRGFIKDRVRRKIIEPIDLTDFKIPEEEVDAIYLSNDEIAAIYKADLSGQSYLEPYRDLFVFACLTGLRFSDFLEVELEDFQQGFLYKKQEKSEHWVVIPLRKEAMEIINNRFVAGIPKLSNAKFNSYVKIIGLAAGIKNMVKFSDKKGNKTVTENKAKCDWITTHTARRSFCTNEFLAGTPVKLIMKINGHKTEKDFYKYIRVAPEEAARVIQELWLQRNAMAAFTTSAV